MSYVLLYVPKTQYFHLKRGLDVFNLGINPKIYREKRDAELDLEKLEMYKASQWNCCYNADEGLRIFGKPRWYDERHTKKLTKRQQAKLDWYENAIAINEAKMKFVEDLKLEDIQIVEWKL